MLLFVCFVCAQEIRTKSLDAINVLRITLDSQIEDLEQHFETAHLNYLQNTDTRTTDFKNLTSKDQELSKEIEIKVRHIDGRRLHLPTMLLLRHAWRLPQEGNIYKRKNFVRVPLLSGPQDRAPGSQSEALADQDCTERA